MAMHKWVNTLTSDEVTHCSASSAQPLHDRRHCLALGAWRVLQLPDPLCASGCTLSNEEVGPRTPPLTHVPGCVAPVITCPGGQYSRERHMLSHTWGPRWTGSWPMIPYTTAITKPVLQIWQVTEVDLSVTLEQWSLRLRAIRYHCRGKESNTIAYYCSGSQTMKRLIRSTRRVTVCVHWWPVKTGSNNEEMTSAQGRCQPSAASYS